MKYKNSIVATFAGLVFASGVHATGFSIEIEDIYTLYDSTGSVSADVTFAFGTFAEGFVPTVANVDEWSSHWLTGGDAMGVIEGGTYWTTYFNLAHNNVIAVGAQLYAWAYNILDTESGNAQWLLLSDPEWLGAASAPADWTQHDFVFSSNTLALIGSFDFDAKTGQLGSLSAVPEPATYAALFGVGALGFALFRRRRATVS